MIVCKTPSDLARQCREWQANGETIALTPTMGYFHAGHASLMACGRSIADRLVVSLFVNPAQFGPGEDLAVYPRDFEHDCAIAKEQGADLLFAPEPDAMYASSHAVWVEAPTLANLLCGKSRPGHFRGVCTIVLKLLMLTRANFAVFGQKDWQQLAIVRRMALDLNLAASIISVPTIREPDGLAMSSRNVYLKPAERSQAPAIYQGLRLAQKLAKNGETNANCLIQAALAHWRANLPDADLDYLTIVNPDTLQPVEELESQALMACALRLGATRLIDNILLN